MIKRAGKRLRTEHLEARMAVSLLSYCRVAVIVAKYKHTIVERNRLRRRIRELARMCLLPSCVGMDLIVRALPSAYGVNFGQLGDEMNQIKKQLLLTISRD